jgi:hypothetical protein
VRDAGLPLNSATCVFAALPILPISVRIAKLRRENSFGNALS